MKQSRWSFSARISLRIVNLWKVFIIVNVPFYAANNTRKKAARFLFGVQLTCAPLHGQQFKQNFRNVNHQAEMKKMENDF